MVIVHGLDTGVAVARLTSIAIRVENYGTLNRKSFAAVIAKNADKRNRKLPCDLRGLCGESFSLAER
jgi:hypothetical protein